LDNKTKVFFIVEYHGFDAFWRYPCCGQHPHKAQRDLNFLATFWSYQKVKWIIHPKMPFTLPDLVFFFISVKHKRWCFIIHFHLFSDCKILKVLITLFIVLFMKNVAKPSARYSTPSNLFYYEAVYTTFLLLCKCYDVNLHDNSVLGAWKQKLLRTGLTIIISNCKWQHLAHVYMFSLYCPTRGNLICNRVKKQTKQKKN